MCSSKKSRKTKSVRSPRGEHLWRDGAIPVMVSIAGKGMFHLSQISMETQDPANCTLESDGGGGLISCLLHIISWPNLELVE